MTPSTVAPPLPCPARDLTVATYGGDGHSGGGVTGVGLTNTGDTVCRLSGALDVVWVDAAGRRLPTTATITDGGRSTLSLRPGATGYFGVVVGSVPAADEGGAPCDPPAAGLRITPRGSGGSVLLKGSWRACGHGRVEIGPLRATRDPNWHD
ncbi:DUF4232 domain-containing protein [Dactylosporangium aurantiacum]|uniref:DUF4232 domain-containing protein n=1 Tax=Dactylosporangium aurantiacum TaxID=35754 RepID=A0A9Q9IP25_9ACTN|nr:DUF4232 domain-containing protein [Dactylosporangium aurantiacum]